jgi:hypothetical protein
MRIFAFLTLPILMTAGIPAFATPLSGAESAKSRLIGAKPGRLSQSATTVHRRRGNRIRTIDGPSGLMITNFKPDGRRAFTNRNYLPHFTDNLAYETGDYRNRFWRLKKVSPGSVVASVKYRF